MSLSSINTSNTITTLVKELNLLLDVSNNFTHLWQNHEMLTTMATELRNQSVWLCDITRYSLPLNVLGILAIVGGILGREFYSSDASNQNSQNPKFNLKHWGFYALTLTGLGMTLFTTCSQQAAIASVKASIKALSNGLH